MATYSYPIDQPTLAFSTVMLSTALYATLEALAEVHQNQPGAWLDELESAALSGAKGTITEGISEEIEARPARSALSIVEKHFERLRNQLAPGK